MAKPPVPNTKPIVSLFPPKTCVVCYHASHGPYGRPCHANDDAWTDPMVGGDPNAEPRECGCREYADKETAGRFPVVIESLKAYAPFTPEQVENLRERQLAGLHEYTCIAHSTSPLWPGSDGLVCPILGCGFKQKGVLKEDVQSQWWKQGIDNLTNT